MMAADIYLTHEKLRQVPFSEKKEVFLLLRGKRTALAGCRERGRCVENSTKGTESRMRRCFVLVTWDKADSK